MKILIIGNLTGNIEAACTQQLSACQQINAAGHEPQSIMYKHGWQGAANGRLQILIQMLLTADAVLLLPDWQHDVIAQTVIAAAHSLAIPVVPARNTILPAQLTFFLNNKIAQDEFFQHTV